jgi:hypothetical protein
MVVYTFKVNFPAKSSSPDENLKCLKTTTFECAHFLLMLLSKLFQFSTFEKPFQTYFKPSDIIKKISFNPLKAKKA